MHSQKVDQSIFMDVGIQDVCWSQCGGWLAYAKHSSSTTSTICITNSKAPFKPRKVTCGLFKDSHPAFDLEGRYLYFISARSYEPVPDEV